MLCYGARASVVGARQPSLQVGSCATPGAGLARGFHDVLRERPCMHAWDDALSEERNLCCSVRCEMEETCVLCAEVTSEAMWSADFRLLFQGLKFYFRDSLKN